MNRKWLLLGVFALALVVSPYLACSNKDEAPLTYEAADMKAALLGTWQGTADIGGESLAFSLTLEQATAGSKVRSVRSSTTLPVVGVIISERPELNGPVDGSFEALRTLDSVNLSLRLEDGKTLSGSVKDDALSEGAIQGGDADDRGSFSLSRP